jgi:Tol biopolymer transport system component
MKITITHLIFILVLTLSGKAQNYNDEIFKNPPDTISKIFGKGLITIEDRAEFGLAISPSYDEIFFTATDGLMFIKKETDGSWSSPMVANLRGDNKHEMEAFYTPNGEQLYFTSGDTTDTNRIWRSVKEKSGWSKAELLNSPVNKTPVFWATFSNTNTMYYTNLAVGKIYRSVLVDGEYSKTSDLGIEGFQLHPTIAADESYILFNSRRPDSFGELDIYIAFKTNKGTWTAPINLGEHINTNVNETCPSISPDGKFIFFSRYNDLNGKPDIYWVSSSVIDKLKREIIL